MNIHLHPRTLLLAALALPLAAQEATTTQSAAPPLVVRTAKEEIAQQMAFSFGYMDALPDLAEGSHYVLALGADQKLSVRTATGDVGTLSASIDPAGLLQMFQEQVEAMRPMLRGAMTTAMTAQGLSAKQAVAFADGMLDFPKQLAKVELKLVGNFEDPAAIAESGLDLELSVEPKAGGWLQPMVDALQAAKSGVPVLPRTDGAMQMQMSLAPESMAALGKSTFDFFAGFMGAKGEELQQLRQYWELASAAYDGTFAMAFGEGMQMQVVAGLRDAAAAARMLDASVIEAMTKGPTIEDVRIEPKAASHRGVDLTLLHMEFRGQPNPMLPDNKLDLHTGIAGNWLVGGSEAAAKSLTDAALDQKIQRKPLPGGELMQMQLDMAMLAAMSGEELPPEAPAKMTMSLGKRGKALALRLQFK